MSSHQVADQEPPSHLAVSHMSVGSVITRAATLSASPHYLNGLPRQWSCFISEEDRGGGVVITQLQNVWGGGHF